MRAVDAVKAHDAVDASRVAVLGGSQGGGLALAVAGLRDDVVATVADVPFLCHYQRASQICPSSTVFAAYHRYAGPARIEVFTYNGHEGGAEYDPPRRIEALRGVFGQ